MAFPARSGVVKLGDLSTTTATSRTLTFDASWQVGDVITTILYVGAGNTVTFSAPPAGWVQVGSTDYNGTVLGTAVFQHVMQPGESSSTTAVFSVSAARMLLGYSFAMAAVSPYMDASSPVFGQGTNASVNDLAPAYTTLVANTYVVSAFAARWTTTTGVQTLSAPGTHTQLALVQFNPTAAASISAVLAYLTTSPTAVGTYGTYTATAQATPTNNSGLELVFFDASQPETFQPVRPRRRLWVPWRRQQVSQPVPLAAGAPVPAATRRRRLLAPVPRRRVTSVPPKPAVAATQALPPQSGRHVLPQLPRRRGRATQVTLTPGAMPPQGFFRRPVRMPWRRSFTTTPLTSGAPAVTTQALPPQPASRRPARRSRRAGFTTTPIIPPAGAPPLQPASRRQLKRQQRRAFTATPVQPGTVAQTTQALPPQTQRDRLFWVPKRRASSSQPLPVTAAGVATPPFVAQPIRDRLVWFPRRRATSAQPPTGKPSQPPILGRGRHATPPPVRRGTRTTTAPSVAVRPPPPLQGRHRPILPPQTRRGRLVAFFFGQAVAVVPTSGGVLSAGTRTGADLGGAGRLGQDLSQGGRAGSDLSAGTATPDTASLTQGTRNGPTLT